MFDFILKKVNSWCLVQQKGCLPVNSVKGASKLDSCGYILLYHNTAPSKEQTLDV